MGEALKRLRRMVPAGPKDLVNVDKTIRETLRNAGEIEIVFDRRLTDRLKVILMIDNGGWSMEPYVESSRPCSTMPAHSSRTFGLTTSITPFTTLCGRMPDAITAPNNWKTFPVATPKRGSFWWRCKHVPL